MQELFASQLRRLAINKDTLTKLKTFTREYLSAAFNTETERRKLIESEYQSLEEKLNRLTQMRIEDEIEKDEYLNLKSEANNRRDELDALRLI